MKVKINLNAMMDLVHCVTIRDIRFSDGSKYRPIYQPTSTGWTLVGFTTDRGEVSVHLAIEEARQQRAVVRFRRGGAFPLAPAS